jgi:CRP/FNR family cyclic AMP-dependent transcriptional regulator
VKVDAGFLGELKGFSRLALETRKQLAEQLELFRLKPRARVFVPGERANHVYLVLRGLVLITEPNRDLTSVVGPGEIFGLSALVFEQPTLFSYRALADSWIARTRPEDFVRVAFGVSLEKIGLLLDFFFKRWWGGTILRVFSQPGLSVEDRLERVLRELGDKIGVRDSRGTILDATISQQTLAELIGASRPSTTEAIGKLIDSGKLIRDRRRMILVDDPAGERQPPQSDRRAS